MKMATTPAEQRRWMRQWRNPAIALNEVRRDELASLTEAAAWVQIESLLSLAPHHNPAVAPPASSSNKPGFLSSINNHGGGHLFRKRRIN
jgi:hypothetical protein